MCTSTRTQLFSSRGFSLPDIHSTFEVVMAAAIGLAGYVNLRVSSSLGTAGFGNRYQTSLSVRELKVQLKLILFLAHGTEFP